VLVYRFGYTFLGLLDSVTGVFECFAVATGVGTGVIDIEVVNSRAVALLPAPRGMRGITVQHFERWEVSK
jgi:hypothetical protein